eukprot:CAMPEP_0182895686 /NCGR_PEP_ID=MMETSP0034_2-20130328/25831_1 /TAXON_ID=156128 /ORGANISM="Nephroselmis pyriformis, Strain CCMP717" /LENGTH=332 /DNA_ID=CAMNT_0025029525 /DNA_START=150 /DNA_END=1144 /DNA_ORIENTATION=+
MQSSAQSSATGAVGGPQDENDEDEDLRRALEASRIEAGGSGPASREGTPGRAHPSGLSEQELLEIALAVSQEEDTPSSCKDDEALAKAIHDALNSAPPCPRTQADAELARKLQQDLNRESSPTVTSHPPTAGWFGAHPAVTKDLCGGGVRAFYRAPGEAPQCPGEEVAHELLQVRGVPAAHHRIGVCGGGGEAVARGVPLIQVPPEVQGVRRLHRGGRGGQRQVQEAHLLGGPHLPPPRQGRHAPLLRVQPDAAREQPGRRAPGRPASVPELHLLRGSGRRGLQAGVRGAAGIFRGAGAGDAGRRATTRGARRPRRAQLDERPGERERGYVR